MVYSTSSVTTFWLYASSGQYPPPTFILTAFSNMLASLLFRIIYLHYARHLAVPSSVFHPAEVVLPGEPAQSCKDCLTITVYRCVQRNYPLCISPAPPWPDRIPPLVIPLRYACLSYPVLIVKAHPSSVVFIGNLKHSCGSIAVRQKVVRESVLVILTLHSSCRPVRHWVKGCPHHIPLSSVTLPRAGRKSGSG